MVEEPGRYSRAYGLCFEEFSARSYHIDRNHSKEPGPGKRAGQAGKMPLVRPERRWVALILTTTSE